jgi:hypothetical protein
MNEQRLQLIANKCYELPDTRIEDLEHDTSEEELELYLRTFRVAESIIKTMGRTKASKQVTKYNHLDAKLNGELRYIDERSSKPTPMGVYGPDGNELLGQTYIHKHYGRRAAIHVSTFRLIDSVGSLGVSYFTHDAAKRARLLYHGTALPLTPNDGVSARIRSANHLTNLQAMEEIALSVDQIRAATKR